MKRLISILCALAALTIGTPSALSQVTYTANSGVSLFSGQSATATATSGPVRLPTFSGYGTLSITYAGITGSPSGCTLVLKYQGNNSPTAGATQATITLTPSNGVAYAAVTPTQPSGDNYVAVYACSSAYPTAGTLTVSFSPGGGGASQSVAATLTSTGDPCLNPNVAKVNVSVAVASATTTQLVALSSGKAVYPCSFLASVVGTSPTLAFEYGTGSSCGTGTTALTGTMSVATGTVFFLAGEGVRAGPTPAGNAVCLVTGGTITGVNGYLVYVQQ